MGFMQEFKAFAVKGNAVDMAVGIVLGASFNRVVTSIVNDLLMPPIGYLVSEVEVKQLQYTLKPAGVDAAGVETPEVAIRYGQFINSVIDFCLIALTVFFVVKVMNRALRARSVETG